MSSEEPASPEQARQAGLSERDLDPDPFRQFQNWLDTAISAKLTQPLAMALATATPEGLPAVRIVLLRGLDQRGFSFFTNYESRKAQELSANPQAALVIYWAELERQVRIEGRIEKVTPAESDEYFRTRPRGSRISAWASPQSQVVPSREALESLTAKVAARFPGEEVPRPPNWGGYRVLPQTIEFWEGKPDRLHDRLRYRRLEDGQWLIERLAP
jgi:pyridoxamine 5'-phosphate oxidase